MSVFIVLAALLAAAVVAALVLPLLRGGQGAEDASQEQSNLGIYREQLADLDADLKAGTIGHEQWAVSKMEIERRVLEDHQDAAAPEVAPRASRAASQRAALVLGIAIPLLAAGLYAWLGSPAALAPPLPATTNGAANGPTGGAPSAEQINGMVANLAARMKANPQDVQGWIMLGRSYAVLQRYPEAVEAYRQAAALRPQDAQLLADYADALAMSGGRTLAGEPEKIIRQALAADPNNVKALALAGTAAFERKAYGEAVPLWQKAIALSGGNDAELKQSLQDGIAAAQSRMGGVPAKPEGPLPKPGNAAPSTAARLQGTVKLAPALAGRAKPDDTVFVYARAVQGSRMPLAILRRKVSDLPFSFELDDSMAMNPAANLSSAQAVVVVARVSPSGQAVPQKGDLFAISKPVTPLSRGVTLEIAQVVD